MSQFISNITHHPHLATLPFSQATFRPFPTTTYPAHPQLNLSHTIKQPCYIPISHFHLPHHPLHILNPPLQLLHALPAHHLYNSKKHLNNFSCILNSFSPIISHLPRTSRPVGLRASRCRLAEVGGQ